MNAHDITTKFEERVAEYTGAPYAIALDNASNALFLALTWWKKQDAQTQQCKKITIPCRTYPSVPCEIIHAGFNVEFLPVPGKGFKGEYQLSPTPIWDSALRFTGNMYRPGQYQCLSFTGSKKHLKLSKGGMILCDNLKAAQWFRKARFSGRDSCSYHEDNFDNNPVVGWNFYMMPEVAARGLLLMQEFPEYNSDLELPYPDLSKFKLWK
jgi:dTDP-4-amino-4,6-dideoxygalactose transaminase